MADREHRTADQEVACPRCGAGTRRGITPLGRVCEDCSRRVFTLPSGVFGSPARDPGPYRAVSLLGVIGPLFVFGVLVAVTWTVVGDGLSTFDPVVVTAAWGTFLVWILAPSERDGTDRGLLERG